MNNVTISLDAGTPVYTVKHDGDSQRYVFDIQLQPPQSAQEVTLARQDSTNTEQSPFLNICEVQVMGWAKLKSTIANFHFKLYVLFQLVIMVVQSNRIVV